MPSGPPFADHFSADAPQYARARPGYPAALFAWLAAAAPARARAWDAGTGSGQAAVGLAAHLAEVVATDASRAQIAHAAPHPRVRYAVALAEASPLPPASCDLATAAQALHWFDRDRFWAEARRVVRRGGLVAVWCYGHLRVAPAIDEALARFRARVHPYWPPERALVDDAYRSIGFPFDEARTPEFRMAHAWTVDDVLAYLGTWSATRMYLQVRGEDPVALEAPAIRAAWGDAARRTVEWPLALRVGRV